MQGRKADRFIELHVDDARGGSVFIVHQEAAEEGILLDFLGLQRRGAKQGCAKKSDFCFHFYKFWLDVLACASFGGDTCKYKEGNL